MEVNISLWEIDFLLHRTIFHFPNDSWKHLTALAKLASAQLFIQSEIKKKKSSHIFSVFFYSRNLKVQSSEWKEFLPCFDVFRSGFGWHLKMAPFVKLFTTWDIVPLTERAVLEETHSFLMHCETQTLYPDLRSHGNISLMGSTFFHIAHSSQACKGV